MEAVSTLENRSFLERFVKQNDDIYEELQSRLDSTVLRVMKNYLRENRIDFDGSSIDLQEFKNTVVKKLPQTQQLAMTKIEKDINKELVDMTKALHDGSQTAFSAMTEKLGEFGKSAVKMTARASAMQIAYALSPTFGGAALATSIAVPAVVKGIKDFKNKDEEARSASIDAILLNLCSVKDKETGETKFEVSTDIMRGIQSMMERDNISINTSDTIKFIRDIAGLDIKDKERAVRKLNSEYGYSAEDFDKQIKSLKTRIENVKKVMKEDVVAPLSTAAMVGLNIGNSLATWNPELSASVVTALGTGIATGNIAVATAAGVTQYGASQGSKLLPSIISDTVQGINEIETMAASTGIVFTGALLLKVVPTLVKHGIIGVKNFIQTKSNDKKNRKALDNQEKAELGKKIDKSLELTTRTIEGKSAREISLGIIADTLRARGVEIDNTIISSEELKKYTQSLDVSGKKEVVEVVKALEKAEELKGNQLKQALSGLAKCAYWGGVIALAGLGTYDAFINPGFIEGLVAREAYGIDMESTVEEKLTELRDSIKSMPDKLDNMKDNIADAISDPKGFMERRAALRQNAKDMTAEHKKFLEESGVTVPEFETQEEVSAWIEEQYNSAIAARQAEAEKKFELAINEFRTDLPEDMESKIMMYKVGIKLPVIPNLDINVSTNDLVIRGLELDTEEGVLKLLKEVGSDYEGIQKLMKTEGVSTLEELAKCENVKIAIEKLGDTDYFPTTEEAQGNFFTRFFSGYVKRDYSSNMVDIINHRTDRIMKFMPTQQSSNEDITEFLKWICDTDGNVNEEKLKFYTLLQEKVEMSDNSGTGEAIRRILTNMEVDENSDELLDQLGTAMQTYINGQAEANRNEIEELFMIHRDTIKEAEELIDIVKETESGFTEGLNSSISSNPLDIMSTGAAVGAAVGTVQVVKNGLFSKVGGFFKKIFGKKQKALPPGEMADDTRLDTTSKTAKIENTLDGYVVSKDDLGKDVPKNDVKKEKSVSDREK